MATRFSATEARLKAESAQKSLKDQRKQNEEIRKGQAKERAFIKVGWKNQRIRIISAAIDGESEIKVNPPIYLYKDLLSAGIQVIEEGLVKHQPHRRDEEADNDAFRRIKGEMLQRFDEFIDASKHELKGYYGGVTRFHKSHYQALHEAMNSDRDYMFYGDEIWLEYVPVDVSEKYFDYIENIDKKMREYRDLRRDVELKVEDDFYGDKLINGEYIFTEDDIDEDLLKPSVEGNTLKIRWTAEECSPFMNDPLLSDSGLAWLAAYRGQLLIEAIFESLGEAAEAGKTNLKLDFSLSKDGWYFVRGQKKIYGCMPDELVEIIERERFTIDDTTSSQKSYCIKVSW